VANGPAKWLVRRGRPGLDGVPLVRQLRSRPGTSSFPSGHSASAAAFAAGVAIESGVLAAPVGILAAGVAYGRVHTGVHYPGDEVELCQDAESIGDTLEKAAARARILGVAGGDGTVNGAAGVAMEHGLPLAVFPAGTLNHFAGDLGVDDIDDVITSVAEGSAV